MEKYFVISDGDAPYKLCFSKEEAIKYSGKYIDCFDENGLPITVYERQEDGSYIQVKS